MNRMKPTFWTRITGWAVPLFVGVLLFGAVWCVVRRFWWGGW